MGAMSGVSEMPRKDMNFCGALENHCLVAVDQDAVFYMQADGAREHDLFQIAALADQVIDGVAMGDADYILLDDGAVVENFSDVMAGCTDQLYATLEGLMIWARANEGRQE